MNDLAVYSQDTLGTLWRAFVKNGADFIVFYHSRRTPEWQWSDRTDMLSNGDFTESDISCSQETISELRPTESFLELLKKWRPLDDQC